eukprot:Seg253.19 transcript_id=Seg253.19/GoldUCD/mRNA.D3Y31 product="hypothetical protein" protein_id=Seg253.19/GoldUCD/D3Y31
MKVTAGDSLHRHFGEFSLAERELCASIWGSFEAIFIRILVEYTVELILKIERTTDTTTNATTSTKEMRSLLCIVAALLCFLVVNFVSGEASSDDDDLALDAVGELKAENAVNAPIASPRRGGGRSSRRRSSRRNTGNTGNIAKPCNFITSFSIFVVIFAVMYSVRG